MFGKTLIKNGLIITMDGDERVFRGDILIKDRKIIRVGKSIDDRDGDWFDAEPYLIVPGLIQTHVHLCQTLFRNLAEDLSLMDWLQKKIWPYEGNHTVETIAVSARLGIAELLLSGTTTIMDMGTVLHEDTIFEELAKSGLRAVAGKAMMDLGRRPEGLRENTSESINESLRLLKKWHNFDHERLKYAFAPRFALSCTDDLLKETFRLTQTYHVLFHTHAAENIHEVGLIRERFGVSNIRLFEKLGITGRNVCLAHCIWTDEEDRQLLKEHEIKVLHCPSANLKLGSGIAPIPDYLDEGITVSIGADGAPCNNNMNIFQEMRLAALIQKPKYGALAMPAKDVLKMATINGARTLGLEHLIGSIEAGKRADLTLIKMNQVHSIPYDNIYNKLIFSSQAADVEYVMVDGKWLLKGRRLQTIDLASLLKEVPVALKKIDRSLN